MRYFDASALAKRDVREPGSLRVRRLLSSDTPATGRLSAVEIGSADATPAPGPDRRRRSRPGPGRVDRDLAAMLVVELAPVVVDRAMSVLRRHALRAEDAMQLASYLHLRDALGEESTFVAFDERLVGAARKERVRVV